MSVKQYWRSWSSAASVSPIATQAAGPDFVSEFTLLLSAVHKPRR